MAGERTQALTGGISRKVEKAPPHVRVGLDAYRAALNRRQDWHAAVWAAIDAAIIAREVTRHG